jgi:hypothetical protein
MATRASTRLQAAPFERGETASGRSEHHASAHRPERSRSTCQQGPRQQLPLHQPPGGVAHHPRHECLFHIGGNAEAPQLLLQASVSVDVQQTLAWDAICERPLSFAPGAGLDDVRALDVAKLARLHSPGDAGVDRPGTRTPSCRPDHACRLGAKTYLLLANSRCGLSRDRRPALLWMRYVCNR